MNNQGGKRGRHRNNNGGGRRGGGGGGNPGRQNFDSNGPGVRIRGNATQIHDKYVQLARDAQGNGEHVLAESMLQHAEHYYRILNADQPDRQQRQQSAGQDRYRGRPSAEEEPSETAEQSGEQEQTEGGAAEAVVESIAKSTDAPAAADDGEAEREAERERERRSRPRRDPRADRRRTAPRNEDPDGEGRDALARMLGAPATSAEVPADSAEEEPKKPRRGRPRKTAATEEEGESKPRRRTSRPRRFEASEPSPELPLAGEGSGDSGDTVGAE